MPQSLFKSKAIQIETLSDFLKKQRQQLNLDIKTLGLITQIKPEYLEALEIGEMDKLPAPVYIKGFLKTLSLVYHLPDNFLVESYEKEYELLLPVPKQSKKSQSQFTFNPKNFIISISALSAMLATAYVFGQVRSVIAPPKLVLEEPASDLNLEGNSILVKGFAEVGSNVTINNQSVLLDREGRFNETVILSSGLNVLEISATNKFDRTNKIQRKITASIPEAKIVVKQSINLTLEIGPDSSWVYLEADGVVKQRGTMLAGSIEAFTAKDEILLTTANAGSTKVIYNDKDLGVLGRSGEVLRNVEFTAQ